jgi:hypothetical protein
MLRDVTSRALTQPNPDDETAGIARKPALWIVLSALALGASLLHVLIDYSVGQYGHSSSEMSALEATNIALFGLVYATWATALAWASGGQKTAGVCVLVLTIAWTLLSNGLGALAACAPPCDDASPYQDIAHASNVVVGAAASYTLIRAVRAWPGRVRWLFPLAVIALLIAAWAVEASLAA